MGENLRIVVRGVAMMINYVWGALFSLVFAVTLVGGGIVVALSGARDRWALIGLALAVLLLGGTWFFYSAKVQREEAKG